MRIQEFLLKAKRYLTTYKISKQKLIEEGNSLEDPNMGFYLTCIDRKEGDPIPTIREDKILLVLDDEDIKILMRKYLPIHISEVNGKIESWSKDSQAFEEAMTRFLDTGQYRNLKLPMGSIGIYNEEDYK